MSSSATQIVEILAVVVTVQLLLCLAYLQRKRASTFLLRTSSRLSQAVISLRWMWSRLSAEEHRLNREMRKLNTALDTSQSMIKSLVIREKQLQRLAAPGARKSIKRSHRKSKHKSPANKSAHKANDSTKIKNTSAAEELESLIKRKNVLFLEVASIEEQILAASTRLMKISAIAPTKEFDPLIASNVYSARQSDITSRMEAIVAHRENIAVNSAKLHKNADGKFASNVKKFEALVIKREERAARAADLRHLESDMVVEKNLGELLNRLEILIDSIRDRTVRLKDFVIAQDADLERSYQRLVDQITVAEKLLDDSMGRENSLLHQLRNTSSGPEYDQLKLALNEHRRKNILICHQLHRTACFARRIDAGISLLTILPTMNKNDLAKFKELVTSFAGFLQTSLAKEINREDKTLDLFDEILVGVEARIQHAFINLAKIDRNGLATVEATRLIAEINSIRERMSGEILVLKEQAKKENINKSAALAADRSIMHLILSERNRHSASTLIILEKHVEVLTVVLLVLVSQSNKFSSENE